MHFWLAVVAAAMIAYLAGFVALIAPLGALVYLIYWLLYTYGGSFWDTRPDWGTGPDWDTGPELFNINTMKAKISKLTSYPNFNAFLWTCLEVCFGLFLALICLILVLSGIYIFWLLYEWYVDLPFKDFVHILAIEYGIIALVGIVVGIVFGIKWLFTKEKADEKSLPEPIITAASEPIKNFGFNQRQCLSVIGKHRQFLDPSEYEKLIEFIENHEVKPEYFQRVLEWRLGWKPKTALEICEEWLNEDTTQPQLKRQDSYSPTNQLVVNELLLCVFEPILRRIASEIISSCIALDQRNRLVPFIRERISQQIYKSNASVSRERFVSVNDLVEKLNLLFETRRNQILEAERQKLIAEKDKRIQEYIASHQNELLHLGAYFDDEVKNYLELWLESKTRIHGVHTHIVGAAGSGKSTFMEVMIQDDLDAGRGFCLIDPKGDLYHRVLWYCREKAIPADRIVLLEPSDIEIPFVLNLNPFKLDDMNKREAHVEWLVESCVKAWKLYPGNPDYKKIENMLRTTFRTLVQTQLTFFELDDLLHRGSKIRQNIIKNLPDGDLKSDWERLDDQLENNQFSTRAEDVVSYVQAITRASSSIRELFGDHTKSLDFEKIVNENKIVLINLESHDDNLPESGADFLGVWIIHELYRRHRNGHPYFVYVDEFEKYVSDKIARVLETCRSHGLHFILAHQGLYQLMKDDYFYKSIITNARFRVVFQTEEPDGDKTLADLLFRDTWDTYEVKDTIKSTKTEIIETERQHQSYSQSFSTTTGYNKWNSRSETVLLHLPEGYSSGTGESDSNTRSSTQTVGTQVHMEPVPFKEITSRQFKTLPEFENESIKKIRALRQGEAYVKLPRNPKATGVPPTIHLRVKSPSLHLKKQELRKELLSYKESIYRANIRLYTKREEVKSIIKNRQNGLRDNPNYFQEHRSLVEHRSTSELESSPKLLPQSVTSGMNKKKSKKKY